MASLSPVAEREIYSAPKCNLAATSRLKTNVITRFRVLDCIATKKSRIVHPCHQLINGNSMRE